MDNNKLKFELRIKCRPDFSLQDTQTEVWATRTIVAQTLVCYNWLMRKQYKPSLTNRPSHILQNDSFYFITARTVDAQWFLRPDKYKEILFNKIKDKTQKFSFDLIAYAILRNHYHLMIKVDNAKELPKFMRELNGSSSKEINDADYTVGRKIWWNYYDHVIRGETDFFKHLNYIHQNPVKHEISKTLSYKFSSYDAWVQKKGQEYLDQAFEKYPIVDFLMQGDEF